MKASKMTNEQLARNLEATIPFLMKEARHLTDADEIMTEAAARLRRPTPVDDDLLKMARDIDKLRARLKVAEAHLGEIAEYDQHPEGMDDPGCADGHCCAEKARRALAAIAEEGGAK